MNSMNKTNMKLRSKGDEPFVVEIQVIPNWYFCEEHVRDSMFLRFNYTRISIRHIPILLQNDKCEVRDEKNKRCSRRARFSVLYETEEMIMRNRSLNH